MADLNRTPNPPGSPREKLITQGDLERIEDHVRSKLGPGPVTNEELVEVLRSYDERMKYEIGKQNRNLELWANVHTHVQAASFEEIGHAVYAQLSWRLNDSSGSTVANDETGNERHGTVTGDADPGFGDENISFRGGNSWGKTTNVGYIALETPLTPAEEYTFDLLYEESIQLSNREIANVRDIDGTQLEWIKVDSALYLRIASGTGTTSINTGVSLVDGEVYHLLATCDSNTNEVEAWVDGTLVGTKSTGTPEAIDRCTVGAGGSSSAFGKFADFAIWDYIMSPSEISERKVQVKG